MQRGVERALHPVAVIGFGFPIQDVEDPQQVIELIGGGVIQEGLCGVAAVDLEQAV